jgi:hypothetical protein
MQRALGAAAQAHGLTRPQAIDHRGDQQQGENQGEKLHKRTGILVAR